MQTSLDHGSFLDDVLQPIECSYWPKTIVTFYDFPFSFSLAVGVAVFPYIILIHCILGMMAEMLHWNYYPVFNLALRVYEASRENIWCTDYQTRWNKNCVLTGVCQIWSKFWIIYKQIIIKKILNYLRLMTYVKTMRRISKNIILTKSTCR